MIVVNGIFKRLVKSFFRAFGSLNTRMLNFDASDRAWLFRNREERMDASVNIFEDGRRLFHAARYNFACDYCQGKIVADIACGTGYGTEILYSSGMAEKVVGIDICLEAINYAKRRHYAPGVEYFCSSGEHTYLSSESIDVVVSFETIEHVFDDIVLLTEFNRILKSGGLLICSTPNKWPVEVATCHAREYDRTTFVDVLSHFFEVTRLYNQNSGCDFEFNRSQQAGITETNDENSELAECFIAICTKR